MGTDNTPALAWQGKGSVSITGPAAYILRMQALHQRFHRWRMMHHTSLIYPLLPSFLTLIRITLRSNLGVC
jgi:hypothetical protein